MKCESFLKAPKHLTGTNGLYEIRIEYPLPLVSERGVNGQLFITIIIQR